MPNPYANMSPEEIARQLSTKNVDEILDEAHFDKNRPGMLAFYLLVIKDYFLKLPEDEIAKIFGAALQAEPADPTKNEFTIDGNKRLLTALIQGTGPLFQKMVQGLDKRLADKSYGDVFDNMKSDLPSIGNHKAQALLDDYVAMLKKNYPKDPKIQSMEISVAESLGAATVAETFCCIITYLEPQGKNKPPREVTDEVVIKIMRPEVEKRVLNEKYIFDEVVRQIPGMKASWQAQINTIMSEFDFQNEAQNIDVGKTIYQVHGVKKSKDLELAPNVRSMDRFTMLPPTKNILAMNRAPGSSFDKIYKQTSDKLYLKFANVFKRNPDTGEWLTDQNGQPIPRDNLNPETVFSTRSKVLRDLNDLLDLSYLLKQVSGKWMKEALFVSGIFHNDMHGGNLMVQFGPTMEDNILTVIDYGNLMKLSKDERNTVKNLLVYTLTRDTDKFITSLKSLMKVKLAADTENKLRSIVNTIMQKGAATKDTGYRFTCILEELRKLGLNLPPQIYGVTQGLNRLQSSLDDAALQIGKSKLLYAALQGDVPLSGSKHVSTGAESLEGEIYTNLATIALNNDNSYTVLLAEVNKATAEVNAPHSAFRQEMRKNLKADLFAGLKNLDQFRQKYVSLAFELEVKKQFDETLKAAHTEMQKALKAGLKLEDFDRLTLLSQQDPQSLSFEDKNLLQTLSSLQKQLDTFEELVVKLHQGRLSKLAQKCQTEKDHERYATVKLDPETQEPDDVFSNFTFTLEEVIGEVVDDVKQHNGILSLSSGMGFFGGANTLRKAVINTRGRPHPQMKPALFMSASSHAARAPSFQLSC